MMDERYRELLAGYVDGELTPEEKAEFEAELARNPELRAELEEFTRLKEVTNKMHYADIPDEVWQSYWQSVYRKTERNLAAADLSAGFQSGLPGPEEAALTSALAQKFDS